MAAIRPDAWNLPLLLHVLGAMVAMGGLVLALTALAATRGADAVASVRLGYRALLLGTLPAYVVMRASAEWIADKEGINDLDEPPSWVDIGYMVAEPGLVLIIVATVLTGLAARRASAEGNGVKVATALVALTVLAYLVAIWAMTTKPT